MTLNGPQILAVAYAPKALKNRLRWLLLFDQRLQDLQQKAREPLIAQMRLAWWRDVLAKPVGERPKGEPLLLALTDLEGEEAVLPTALALVDAWELAICDPDTGASLQSSKRRAEAIFLSYAIWSGCAPYELEVAMALGMSWANPGADYLISKSGKLRPLSILALAAHLEWRGVGRANGLRLNWHALTGR